MGASPDEVVDPKARILDAAADAFMRHGFADTTVDDIADTVGNAVDSWSHVKISQPIGDRTQKDQGRRTTGQ